MSNGILNFNNKRFQYNYLDSIHLIPSVAEEYLVGVRGGVVLSVAVDLPVTSDCSALSRDDITLSHISSLKTVSTYSKTVSCMSDLGH